MRHRSIGQTTFNLRLKLRAILHRSSIYIFSERFSVDSPPSEFNLSSTTTHSSRKVAFHRASVPLNALLIKNSSYLRRILKTVFTLWSICLHPNQCPIHVHIRIYIHICSMRLMVSTTRAQWGGDPLRLIGHKYQNMYQCKSSLLLTVVTTVAARTVELREL